MRNLWRQGFGSLVDSLLSVTEGRPLEASPRRGSPPQPEGQLHAQPPPQSPPSCSSGHDFAASAMPGASEPCGPKDVWEEYGSILLQAHRAQSQCLRSSLARRGAAACDACHAKEQLLLVQDSASAKGEEPSGHRKPSSLSISDGRGEDHFQLIREIAAFTETLAPVFGESNRSRAELEELRATQAKAVAELRCACTSLRADWGPPRAGHLEMDLALALPALLRSCADLLEGGGSAPAAEEVWANAEIRVLQSLAPAVLGSLGAAGALAESRAAASRARGRSAEERAIDMLIARMEVLGGLLEKDEGKAADSTRSTTVPQVSEATLPSSTADLAQCSRAQLQLLEAQLTTESQSLEQELQRQSASQGCDGCAGSGSGGVPSMPPARPLQAELAEVYDLLGRRCLQTEEIGELQRQCNAYRVEAAQRRLALARSVAQELPSGRGVAPPLEQHEWRIADAVSTLDSQRN